MNEFRSFNLKIAVIGLGYVGLPLALAFSENYTTVGYDISKKRIEELKKGFDSTKEVDESQLENSDVYFTSELSDIVGMDFYIVAVPTPVGLDKVPDLDPVIQASKIVSQVIKRGSIVVYESTVYPGVTEDICVPIIEGSGLVFNHDFYVGYSPERINPGDKVNKLKTIKKLVSGSTEGALKSIFSLYSTIIEAGVIKVKSIKAAEAAKVIENSQRDINIAFMNEVAIVLHQMDIDTKDVIDAMSTKWNYIPFFPGLVGGHCIGVDPYYFVYRAEQLGYHSQIILAGRKINDYMPEYISNCIIKKMIEADKKIKGSKVGFFGITFKENCPDTRNSKAAVLVRLLRSYGIDCLVHDPIANRKEVIKEYGIELSEYRDIKDLDAAIFAVKHNEYLNISLHDISKMMKNENCKSVLVDIKSIFDKESAESANYMYWSL